MPTDTPKMLKITKITTETLRVKTFYFNYPLNSRPGQFVMVWIPGVDQKPFSIGYDDGKKFGLTVCAVGNFSKKFSTMKVGEKVGVSGPYGTSFSLKSNTHYITVAGGYGAAPLGYLAEEASKLKNVKIDFLLGAKSCDSILFEKRLSKLKNTTVHCATNDGSKGYRGFVTDFLKQHINTPTHQHLNPSTLKHVLVCACGPELMEKKVLDICNEHKINCEVSIERYMKCGLGVCGQCAVDDLGICMCTHGPVVSRELANKIKEFGVYHRDKSGAKHNF
ncbi:MAG: dihydroorotate dehydrogenase electron transfer subunit [Patescibacteria group bacterium]